MAEVIARTLNAITSASARSRTSRPSWVSGLARSLVTITSTHTVIARRSGVSLAVEVPGGTSILEVLNKAGIDISSSCCAGVCGTRLTDVVCDLPEHRDMVLIEEKKRPIARWRCVARDHWARPSYLTCDIGHECRRQSPVDPSERTTKAWRNA